MTSAPSLLDLIRTAPRLGLYVHLPFCSALCPYCDFAVVVGRDGDHGAYIDALLIEARARAAENRWNPVHTVFLGGGTPSLMDAMAVARLLDGLRDVIGFADDVEISIEANPDSVTADAMRTLAAAGVNRVSVGAQSFDERVLAGLGRTHDAAAIPRAVEAVRASGIDEVNLDLIYGSVVEGADPWLATLEAALALEPTHLSCYGLTIEPRTAFGTREQAGERLTAPDDDLADRFLEAIDTIEAAGLRQYEVSNFARPGSECRHNLGIWCGGDYLGLGIGAHSLRAAHRWWNARNLAAYLAEPAGSKDGDEQLDASRRAEEWLSTRIRLRAGFPQLVAEAVLPGLVDRAAPLLDVELLHRPWPDYLATTRTGMLLDNEVTARLLG